MRRRLALLILLPCLFAGVTPALAQKAGVRQDLTGRWGMRPLVVQYYCYQYRRSGYIDLRPKAGKTQNVYAGQAWFQIERIPTNQPGCIPPPALQRDRVSVEVVPCSSEELPRVTRRPRRGPCYVAHFSSSERRIGYAAEIWLPRKGHILSWGSRFALRYRTYYSAITAPGG